MPDFEQIGIAGDDEVCSCFQSAFQNAVVGGIPADSYMCFGPNHLSIAQEVRLNPFGLSCGQAEWLILPGQYVVQFSQQSGRDNCLEEAYFGAMENFFRRPQPERPGDQNVRVQDCCDHLRGPALLDDGKDIILGQLVKSSLLRQIQGPGIEIHQFPLFLLGEPLKELGIVQQFLTLFWRKPPS